MCCICISYLATIFTYILNYQLHQLNFFTMKWSNECEQVMQWCHTSIIFALSCSLTYTDAFAYLNSKKSNGYSWIYPKLWLIYRWAHIISHPTQMSVNKWFDDVISPPFCIILFFDIYIDAFTYHEFTQNCN